MVGWSDGRSVGHGFKLRRTLFLHNVECLSSSIAFQPIQEHFMIRRSLMDVSIDDDVAIEQYATVRIPVASL